MRCYLKILGLSVGLINTTYAKAHDPKDDVFTVEMEQYFGDYGKNISSLPMGGNRRFLTQLYFPTGKVYDKQTFMGLQAGFLDKEIEIINEPVTNSPIQRHEITGGIVFLESQRQEAVFMLSGGYNGIKWDANPDVWSSEWIYIHMLDISEKLRLGFGLDLLNYFDQWTPYPLFFFDYWLSESTKLKLNGDILEVRQYLWEKYCAMIGLKYNLEYASLGSGYTFEEESVAIELGFAYRLAGNFYFRMKIKEEIWGTEEFNFRDSRFEKKSVKGRRAIKAVFSYAL